MWICTVIDLLTVLQTCRKSTEPIRIIIFLLCFVNWHAVYSCLLVSICWMRTNFSEITPSMLAFLICSIITHTNTVGFEKVFSVQFVSLKTTFWPFFWVIYRTCTWADVAEESWVNSEPSLSWTLLGLALAIHVGEIYPLLRVQLQKNCEIQADWDWLTMSA